MLRTKNQFLDSIGTLSEKKSCPNHQIYISDKINAILVQNRIESLKVNGMPLQGMNNIVNFAKNMHAIHHHKSCFKYDCEY